MSLAEERQTPKKSIVWDYYERVNPEQVLCYVCRKLFRFNNTSSTSNLLKHIRTKHSNGETPQKGHIPMEGMPTKKSSKRSSGPSSPSSVAKASKGSDDFKETPVLKKHAYDLDKTRGVDRLILGLIVKDLQPFSIVKDPGFVDFVKGMNPKSSIPSKNRLVETHLPQVYEETKCRIYSELQMAQSVSISTEIWSNRRGQLFLSISAHFISNQWIPRSVMLETVKLSGNYTSSDISSELYRILEAWDISNKIFCVTTDSDSNMAAAVAQLNINHQISFAKTLNKVVLDALKNVQGIDYLRGKVMDIVTLFETHAAANDTLNAMQQVQGKLPSRLKGHVYGQWITMYKMFKRYAILHENVTKALKSLGKQDLTINDGDVELIKEIVKALEPLALAVIELSNDKVLILSKVIPLTKTLMALFDRCSNTCRLAEELANQLTQHFSHLESNTFTAAATYLDPRFREVSFEDETTCGSVQEELKCMMEIDYMQSGIPEGKQSIKKQLESSMSLWSDFDQKVQAVRTSTSGKVSSVNDMELGRYDGENLILRMENPLEWWQIKEKIYPALSKLAKQFLSASASHVPPELLFTKAGRIKCERRANLKDSVVNQVLFLHQNYKDISG